MQAGAIGDLSRYMYVTYICDIYVYKDISFVYEHIQMNCIL